MPSLEIGPGTVCAVTGASSGIGRALARELATRGASVALLARGQQGLAAAAAEVDACGSRALGLPTDVAVAVEVEAAARAESVLGPVDAWFNVAMATVFAPFWEIEPEEFRRATEVTYLGFVHGTMAALRRMRPRDRGVVVQVGSALAYRPIPLQSAYCGAKHAIRGFTDPLRAELVHEGSSVRVVTVHLPAHNTPQFDLARSRLPRRPRPVAPVYQPEVAARAIVHAAEHVRRELWAGHTTTAAILANRLAGLARPVPRSHGLRGAANGRSRQRAPRLPLRAGPRRPRRARTLREGSP